MTSRKPINGNMLKQLCLKLAVLAILIAIPIAIMASVDIADGDSADNSVGNEQEIVVNTNRIAGEVWYDANGNGTYDADEQPIADYPIHLYEVGNTQNAVQTAATDAGGQYCFTELQPGRYVVGVRSAKLDETEYSVPVVGVTSDNRFTHPTDTEDGMFALSEPMEIGTDTLQTDVDAGMRKSSDLAAAPADLGTSADEDRQDLDSNGNTADDQVSKDLDAGATDEQVPSDLGTSAEDNPLPLDSAENMAGDLASKDLGAGAADDQVPSDLNTSTVDNQLPLDSAENMASDLASKDLGTGATDDRPPSDLGTDTMDNRLPVDSGESAADESPRLDLDTSTVDDTPRLDLDTNTVDDSQPVIQESDTDEVNELPVVLETDGDDQHADDAYAGEISGKLWHDSNGNGLRAENTLSVRGYAVYLYNTDDTQNAVQSTETNADGTYTFAHIQPGRYVVGIESVMRDGIQYLVPTVGITMDNKFICPNADADESHAYSQPIEIQADTVVTGIDAAMRTVYDLQSASGMPLDSNAETEAGDAGDEEVTTSDENGIFATSISPRGPSPFGSAVTGEKNAYLNGATTADNGTSTAPVKVEADDAITYEITVEKPKIDDPGGQYDVLFVLDWSNSMTGNMAKDENTTQKALDYGRHLVMEMSKYIFANYPHSRIALMGHNAEKNCTNNANYLNLQYDTRFVGASAYETVIADSFKVSYHHDDDDNGQAFKAAIDKMSGDASAIYGSLLSKGNKAVKVVPRDDLGAGRIPVIVLISDFQIGETTADTWCNKSGYPYWSKVMKDQADRYSTAFPEGILMTVRLDHHYNVSPSYRFHSTNAWSNGATYNNLMINNVAPAGRSRWSFTALDQTVTPANALTHLEGIFKTSAPIPKEMKVTDVIPDGMTILSTTPTAKVTGQKVEWDLTAQPPGTYTMTVNVKVDDPGALASVDYANTATVSIQGESDYHTNTTYHRLSDHTQLTVSKTVEGASDDKTKDFAFTLSFADHNDQKLPVGTQFAYTGNAIAGVVAPPNGTLTLDADGKATVYLRHGQSITIAGLTIGSKVRIVETGNSGYDTSFVDSGIVGAKDSADTNFLVMTDDSRSVDFTNKKSEIPITGISLGNTNTLLLLMLLPLLAFGGAMIGKTIYRHRRTK